MHTGTDAESGLVHSIEATAANVHDANVLGQLLHGEEQALYGDSAYHSQQLKELAEGAGLQFNVNQRGFKDRPLTQRQKARNRRLSKVRAVVEHPFLVVKRLWGHAKVRYRGLAKNLAQMYTLFGLAKLYRVRKHSLLRRRGASVKPRNEQNGRFKAPSEPLKCCGVLCFTWLRCAWSIATDTYAYKHANSEHP